MPREIDVARMPYTDMKKAIPSFGKDESALRYLWYLLHDSPVMSHLQPREWLSVRRMLQRRIVPFSNAYYHVQHEMNQEG